GDQLDDQLAGQASCPALSPSRSRPRAGLGSSHRDPRGGDGTSVRARAARTVRRAGCRGQLRSGLGSLARTCARRARAWRAGRRDLFDLFADVGEYLLELADLDLPDDLPDHLRRLARLGPGDRDMDQSGDDTRVEPFEVGDLVEADLRVLPHHDRFVEGEVVEADELVGFSLHRGQGLQGPPRLKSSLMWSRSSSSLASTWPMCLSRAGSIARSIRMSENGGGATPCPRRQRAGPRPRVPFWRGAT